MNAAKPADMPGWLVMFWIGTAAVAAISLTVMVSGAWWGCLILATWFAGVWAGAVMQTGKWIPWRD